MEDKYLIDTNIIIYYLDNKIPEQEVDKVEGIFRDSFNISTITKIEVLGWHKIEGNEKNRLNQFISNAKVFYIDYSIEEKSIEIKQKSKVATPDTIIGATAIINDLIVVSRNTKDFEKIEGLKFYNPFESV